MNLRGDIWSLAHSEEGESQRGHSQHSTALGTHTGCTGRWCKAQSRHPCWPALLEEVRPGGSARVLLIIFTKKKCPPPCPVSSTVAPLPVLCPPQSPSFSALCFICPHNSSGGQACVFSPRRWELQTSSSLRSTQLLCMGMDTRAQCISCHLQGVYSPRYSCSCRVYCTHRPTWCINNPCACCNQGNRDVGVDSHHPPGPEALSVCLGRPLLGECPGPDSFSITVALRPSLPSSGKWMQNQWVPRVSLVSPYKPS